jgi:carbon monoxide dehydrogenase subunit G
MVRIRHSIVVHRPVQEVFQYISNPDNAAEWVAGIARSEKVTEGRMREGVRGRQVRNFLGQEISADWEVTAFEPNRRIEVTVNSGPLAGARVAEATESAPGEAVESTRVSYTFDGEPQGLWRALRFTEPVATRIFRRQVRSDFTTLKEILESR